MIASRLGWHHLSNATGLNTASSVFYGITSLIRLIAFAVFFTTFEEHLCETSSVGQVLPPESPQQPKTYPHPRLPAARLFVVILRFSVFSPTWGNPEVGGGDNFLGSYLPPFSA